MPSCAVIAWFILLYTRAVLPVCPDPAGKETVSRPVLAQVKRAWYHEGMPIRVRDLLAALIVAETAFVARLLILLPELPWYLRLKKPYLSLPGKYYLFTWAVAFGSIGAASFFYWRGNGSHDLSRGTICYLATLVLSVFWALVFFDLHLIGWSLIVLCVMLFFATETLISFGIVSVRAGFLVVPFIAWFLFGAFLTYGFWLIN